MKTLIISFLINCSVSLNASSQNITPPEYLDLFILALKSNSYTSVNEKLIELNSNWIYQGESDKGNIHNSAWKFVPKNETVSLAHLQIDDIKSTDKTLKVISYMFLQESWFKEHVATIKALKGIEVSNKTEKNGETITVYETVSTAVIFRKIPFNKVVYGKLYPYRYMIKMHVYPF